MRTATKYLKSVDAHRLQYLRFDHVIIGGVEDIASDDPHDALVHHSLMGCSGQPGLSVLILAPKGGAGRHRDGAVWTWRGKETTESGLHMKLNDSGINILHLQ